MIPLAGGIPSPDNFPFETLSASILPPDHLPLDNPRKPADKSLFSWLFSAKKRLLNISVPKYVEHPEPTSIQLATSLQYQAATGPPALPLFLRKYVEAVYKPAYADWDVLINVGNTDGWSKIVGMLMERGDAILVEEWTYPSAQNCLPVDRTLVSVKMDGEGALPSHLEDILGNWDEKKQGKKRPKVFYTVPTGQNPTGATMGLKRKKAIYEICRKYGALSVAKRTACAYTQTSSFARTSRITVWCVYLFDRAHCSIPASGRRKSRPRQSRSWRDDRRSSRSRKAKKATMPLCFPFHRHSSQSTMKDGSSEWT